MSDQDIVRIKALSHPLRMEILKTLARHDQSVPIKEVAGLLKEPPSKLHYHFRQLQEADFIEVAGTREVNGIIERFYRLTGPPDLDLSLSVRDDPESVSASLPLVERRLMDMTRRLLLKIPARMSASESRESFPPLLGSFREVTIERDVAVKCRQALLNFLDGEESRLPDMGGLSQDGETYDLVVLMVPRLEEGKPATAS